MSMKSWIWKKRLHISGSIHPSTADVVKLYAHELVRKLTHEVLRRGGGVVVQVGKESFADGAPKGSPSLHFDWTALEAAAEVVFSGSADWPTTEGAPIVTVTSEKSLSRIPSNRMALWKKLLKTGRIHVETIQPGAHSGAMIRERQGEFGDVLLTLGGGVGVEHLVNLYTRKRRPVIPLDLPLGASQSDGTGGSERLAKESRSDPGRFLRLKAPLQAQAAARLTEIMTHGGTARLPSLVKSIVRLLLDLEPPRIFYVRLLNPDQESFPRVEAFFREVVDPVVARLGLVRLDMGIDKSSKGLMNQDIFENLHYCSVALVDVTALRPNCFIELGYALGRQIKVIATAEKNTPLPFDQSAIPCHFWVHGGKKKARQRALEQFWGQHIERPPLVP
jgi:hypothetical protein